MTTPALVVALALLAGLAVMQILLALGLPYGRLAWGGGHEVLPTRLRIASGLSIPLYALFGAVLASRAGAVPGGDTRFVVVATWVLFGYLTLGVVMNAMSRSRPERLVQTPVCVLLAAATLTIALRAG